MWFAFALLAATAALVSGNAQPQQYPPPPYGQPGALPPGGYPPPGGAYGAYNNTPYQPGLSSANGVPGYPGGNDVFRAVYEWFKIDYAWPDENLKAAALRASQYIPENNALGGIKVWRDRMFLSVPRMKEGVPSTLNSVPAQPRGGSNSPRLDPFPSWEWQELGNCSALQNVHGFEIDSEGRMWVLDSGRVNVKGRTQENRCPPKLVIFDLNTAQFTDNYYNNGYNMNGGVGGYPGPGSVFNDPSRPYDPNRPNQPYDPSRPNQPYHSGQPYDPNRPNQPY
ncbi:protein yellow-like, partial [Frankliniella occidentalis]